MHYKPVRSYLQSQISYWQFVLFQQSECSRAEWYFPFADIFWVEFCKDWHERSQKRPSTHYSLWTVCICCIFICLRTGTRNNYCCWYAVHYPGKFMASVTEKLKAGGFAWLWSRNTIQSWDRSSCLELVLLCNFSRVLYCFLPLPLLLPHFLKLFFMRELRGESLMN